MLLEIQTLTRFQVIDGGEDEVEFGGIIQEDFSGGRSIFNDKVWLIAVFIGENRLKHLMEVGQLGLLSLG